MVILLPINFILGVLGVLIMLGASWALAIGSWLWSCAVPVGIIIIVLYIIWSIFKLVVGFENCSFLGAVSAIVTAVLTVMVLINAYQTAMASGRAFDFSMLVNWILLFAALNISELASMKAISGSYIGLVAFSVLDIGGLLLLNNAIGAGF